MVQLPDEEHLHPVWLCLLRHIASMMPACLHRMPRWPWPKTMTWQGSGHSRSLNEDMRRGNMNSSRSSCAIQKDDFCLRVRGARGRCSEEPDHYSIHDPASSRSLAMPRTYAEDSEDLSQHMMQVWYSTSRAFLFQARVASHCEHPKVAFLQPISRRELVNWDAAAAGRRAARP